MLCEPKYCAFLWITFTQVLCLLPVPNSATVSSPAVELATRDVRCRFFYTANLARIFYWMIETVTAGLIRAKQLTGCSESCYSDLSVCGFGGSSLEQ